MKGTTATLTKAANINKFAELGLGAAMGTVFDAAENAGDLTKDLVDADAKKKFDEANDALAGVAKWIDGEVGKADFDFALVPKDARDAMAGAYSGLKDELDATAKEIRDAIAKGETETKQKLLKQRDALREAMDGAKAMDGAISRAKDVARDRIGAAAARWRDASDMLSDELKTKLKATSDFVGGKVVDMFDSLEDTAAREAFMQVLEVFAEGAAKVTGKFGIDAEHELVFSKAFVTKMKVAEAKAKNIYDAATDAAVKAALGAALEALKAVIDVHADELSKSQERMHQASESIFGVKSAFTGMSTAEAYIAKKATDFGTIMDELQDEGARKAGTMVDNAMADAVKWMSDIIDNDACDLGNIDDITETMDKM